MNFLIYGAGSLGLLFGYHLSKKHNVKLIAKESRTSNLNKNGMVFIENGIEDRISLNAYSDINDIKLKPDFIILAVKSFDIDSSLDDISSVFSNVPVVTIQNGIYAEDAACSMIGNDYVLPAAVLIGSKMINDNTIEQFLHNGMKLGYLDERRKSKAMELNDIFNECSIDCMLSDNIMRDKWYKFMFYCAGATLNSLTGTKNLEDENLQWIVMSVLNEITDTASNLNLNFDVKKLSDEVFDFLMGFKPERWSASIGEDLRKGKITEIDYLNGYVVNFAEKFGIDAPFNKMLTSFVKTIEKTGYFK